MNPDREISSRNCLNAVSTLVVDVDKGSPTDANTSSRIALQSIPGCAAGRKRTKRLIVGAIHIDEASSFNRRHYRHFQSSRSDCIEVESCACRAELAFRFD